MNYQQIAIKDDEHFNLLMFLQEQCKINAWVKDTVVAKGILQKNFYHLPTETGNRYVAVQNVAELRFNYDLLPRGTELELIHYAEGPDFLFEISPGSLSHIGTHVESIDESRHGMEALGFELVQEVITQSHSSFCDRNYHYAIYQNPFTNFFWKHIERIKPSQVSELTDKLLRRAYT